MDCGLCRNDGYWGMIGKLTGIIDTIGSNQLVLDVNGVGYVVYASGRCLARIGGKGDPCAMLIDTHVREDHIHLYGFCDAVEQEWFRLLTKVQGVGAKAALAILSAATPYELTVAITAQDKVVFTRADGVGPKLATRIVTELKDKTGAVEAAGSAGMGGGSPALSVARSSAPPSQGDFVQEALSALVNLGYGRSEAMIAINRAKENLPEEADLSALIRQGLKELSG